MKRLSFPLFKNPTSTLHRNFQTIFLVPDVAISKKQKNYLKPKAIKKTFDEHAHMFEFDFALVGENEFFELNPQFNRNIKTAQRSTCLLNFTNIERFHPEIARENFKSFLENIQH